TWSRRAAGGAGTPRTARRRRASPGGRGALPPCRHRARAAGLAGRRLAGHLPLLHAGGGLRRRPAGTAGPGATGPVLRLPLRDRAPPGQAGADGPEGSPGRPVLGYDPGLDRVVRLPEPPDG